MNPTHHHQHTDDWSHRFATIVSDIRTLQNDIVNHKIDKYDARSFDAASSFSSSISSALASMLLSSSSFLMHWYSLSASPLRSNSASDAIGQSVMIALSIAVDNTTKQRLGLEQIRMCIKQKQTHEREECMRRYSANGSQYEDTTINADVERIDIELSKLRDESRRHDLIRSHHQHDVEQRERDIKSAESMLPSYDAKDDEVRSPTLRATPRSYERYESDNKTKKTAGPSPSYAAMSSSSSPSLSTSSVSSASSSSSSSSVSSSSSSSPNRFNDDDAGFLSFDSALHLSASLSSPQLLFSPIPTHVSQFESPNYDGATPMMNRLTRTDGSKQASEVKLTSNSMFGTMSPMDEAMKVVISPYVRNVASTPASSVATPSSLASVSSSPSILLSPSSSSSSASSSAVSPALPSLDVLFAKIWTSGSPEQQRRRTARSSEHLYDESASIAEEDDHQQAKKQENMIASVEPTPTSPSVALQNAKQSTPLSLLRSFILAQSSTSSANAHSATPVALQSTSASDEEDEIGDEEEDESEVEESHQFASSMHSPSPSSRASSSFANPITPSSIISMHISSSFESFESTPLAVAQTPEPITRRVHHLHVPFSLQSSASPQPVASVVIASPPLLVRVESPARTPMAELSLLLRMQDARTARYAWMQTMRDENEDESKLYDVDAEDDDDERDETKHRSAQESSMHTMPITSAAPFAAIHHTNDENLRPSSLSNPSASSHWSFSTSDAMPRSNPQLHALVASLHSIANDPSTPTPVLRDRTNLSLLMPSLSASPSSLTPKRLSTKELLKKVQLLNDQRSSSISKTSSTSLSLSLPPSIPSVAIDATVASTTIKVEWYDAPLPIIERDAVDDGDIDDADADDDDDNVSYDVKSSSISAPHVTYPPSPLRYSIFTPTVSNRSTVVKDHRANPIPRASSASSTTTPSSRRAATTTTTALRPSSSIIISGVPSVTLSLAPAPRRATFDKQRVNIIATPTRTSTNVVKPNVTPRSRDLLRS